MIRANEAAGLAKVQAAEQLANEHDVGAANDLFFQRRTIGDAGINDCRTQIGESLERLAQAEQAGFDALLGRKVIVFRRSHSAQQNSIAVQAALDGLCRQRCSKLIDGYAADRALGEFELVVIQVRHAAQNAHRFPSDFGTDAVAGQDRDLELHAWRQLLNLQCRERIEKYPTQAKRRLEWASPKTEWATRLCHAGGAGNYVGGADRCTHGRAGELFVDDREQVPVFHNLDLIRQRNKPFVDEIEIAALKLVT